MSGEVPANRHRRSEADERRLIEAAQEDAVRFTEVYEHYFDVVYAYVARRVTERAAREDLTAEVFHKALKSLPRYRWTGAPFASWLFRIASNLIADRARREKSTVSDSELPLAEHSETSTNLQTEFERTERQARVFQLVESLAEDQRLVIVMRFADEKSISEIAAELRRSEGAIKQLQFRAIKNLRRMLDE